LYDQRATSKDRKDTTMTREQVHARRWGILGVLVLALFGVSVDNTILTIALPTLAIDLSASASQLQWMVDAYILVFAGLLLVAGALSDRYGRRLALVTGLGLFGLGSAVAPFVASADQLIALRAFMGLGAALTMPATLSILADVFPAEERPKAIAAWSAVSGLGIVVGPLLGGWLLEHFPWASVFVVNVPFVVVGIAATLAVVPESRAPGRVPLDPIGALLSVAGLGALVYGIIEVPARGWTDPTIAVSLTAAAVLIVAFAAWERRLAHPMLDVRLFRDRRFSAASLSVTLTFFSLMGALFFLTQYLQVVLGLSALETGVRFLPIAFGVMLAAPVSAQLTARIGTRLTTTIGLAGVAAGLALVASLGVASTDLHLAGVLFVTAVGMGLAMTPATDAIMAALPQAKLGVGSAVNDTTREVGGALGVAVLGSLAAGSYAAAIGPLTGSLPPEAAAVVRDSIAGASAVAAAIGGAAGEAILGAARQAFVDAMGWTSLLGAGFAIAGAGLALVFLPDRVNRPAEGAPMTEPFRAPLIGTGERAQVGERAQAA
jgi:EmrB/QacA subfamily drug resistance transporter